MTAVDAGARLVLPAPFDAAEAGAWTEYGRRKVCLTLRGPGQLFRCRYATAWVDVTEQQPWRGEPLTTWGSRRQDDSAMRGSFTNAANREISLLLLPAVARYGFNRWWLELHQARLGEQAVEESERQLADLAREAAWHTARGSLARVYEAGLLDAVPVSAGEDLPRVEQLDYDRRFSRAEPAARLFLDGEHVGWISRDGKLLPVV